VDSDDDERDVKKVKQDTSGRLGKLILVNDGDANNNEIVDRDENTNGIATLVGNVVPMTMSFSNAACPTCTTASLNLTWDTSALRLWKSSSSGHSIMSPGTYDSTYFGLPATGGSATITVEGLQESQSVGDQSVNGGFGNLRAEVKWTVMSGDFQIVVDGRETAEIDELKQEKTILGSPATDKENDQITLNVSAMALFGNNGHLSIEGDKNYLLWSVDDDGALKPYEKDSKIPTAGISGLSLLLMESGIHRFTLKYHAINGTAYELDKIVLNQRFGAASVADYYWGKYEGPNTQLTLDVLSNDKRDPLGASGQIIGHTAAKLGTVVLVDQTFYYNTMEDKYGTDSFSYTAINQYGEKSTSEVVVDIEYVPPVQKSAIADLDPASQTQLRAIHYQFLVDTTKKILGDSLGADFAVLQGVPAMEELATIASWGWTLHAGTSYGSLFVSDGQLVDTVSHRITYFVQNDSSNEQGIFITPYTRIEICRQIRRLIRHQEVTEYNFAYDASGGNPIYAGAEAFIAHKNVRIAAGVAGVAVVAFAGPAAWAAAGAYTGSVTIGTATITTAGVAQAGIAVASTYAVIRAGDDIEATLNDRQRTLVSQGLDKINSYLSHDPRTLTDNLITSTDLAMFVIEVGPGFAYLIRGKQLLQQTSNSSRGGGIAASVSKHVDGGGVYRGELEELVSGLRRIESALDGKKGTTWLRKIANEAEDTEGIINIIDDTTTAGLDEFNRAAIRAGGKPNQTAFTTDDGIIYLRRSRGNSILVDFAHEMTHRIDHRAGGIFKQKGSTWYAEKLKNLDNEQLFRSEFRAFRVGNIVANYIDGQPRFATRKELFDYILNNYKQAHNPY
jgi:hypothetical protein